MNVFVKTDDDEILYNIEDETFTSWETFLEHVVKDFDKNKKSEDCHVTNIELTFYTRFSGWASSFVNDDLMDELHAYGWKTCHDENGKYVKDIDVDQVKAIVKKYAKNAVVEVIVDRLN
jgi:hypothetical protein